MRSVRSSSSARFSVTATTSCAGSSGVRRPRPIRLTGTQPSCDAGWAVATTWRDAGAGRVTEPLRAPGWLWVPRRPARPEVWSDHASHSSCASRDCSHHRGRRLRRDGMQEQFARVASAEPTRVHIDECRGVCEPGQLVVGATFGVRPCCRGERRDQCVFPGHRRSSQCAVGTEVWHRRGVGPCIWH